MPNDLAYHARQYCEPRQ